MNDQNQPISIPEVLAPTAVGEQARAEYDISIATAKRWPRSIEKFRKDAMTLATIDVDVAASCAYKLKRQGRDGEKIIEGPSVRFAEIIAHAYGNLKFAARVVEITNDEVVAQGVCHDLEANVMASSEVRRRITTKEGRRFNADMIVVTANAACSLAIRNAIFDAIPFSLCKNIYDAARKVAIGDASTLAERRQKMIAKFAELGVAPPAIYAKLGVKGMNDIDLTNLDLLLGEYQAIQEGHTTADEAFPKVKASSVTGELKTKKPEFSAEQQQELGAIRAELIELGGDAADKEVAALQKKMAYDAPTDVLDAMNVLLRKWRDIDAQGKAQ